MKRDIPLYLSNHSTCYSHHDLSSIVEWNSAHPQYIPYGQSLFVQAITSKLTKEDYDKYRQTVENAWHTYVNYLKTTYSLDCLLLIGNQDIFSGTAVYGIPRANVTLDYYNPDNKKVNAVAVGFSLGDDLLILRVLQRLEKAKLQAGRIDTRTVFQKYIQYPAQSVYQHGCSIL